MAGRQVGVVEVAGRVVDHAQLLHHAAGAEILRDGEGDDFGKLESEEGVVDDGAGTFCGQSPAPIIKRQPPADFDGGHKGGLEVGDVEADEADEGFGFDEFGGVEAEAVQGEVALDAGDSIVGFARCEKGWEELHYAGVGVELPEGDAV